MLFVQLMEDTTVKQQFIPFASNVSVEEQRQVKAHRQKELQAKALTALNSQIRPWTLRT